MPGSAAGVGVARAQRQSVAGWLFVTPALVILGLFLVIPIVMALWVCFTRLERPGQPVLVPGQPRRARRTTRPC